MDKSGFTTGEVCGILQTSQHTLAAYTREFPVFFSKDAIKHVRGRRFSVADLETAAAIRYLKNQHAGKDKIQAKLQEGWRPAEGTAAAIQTRAEILEQVIQGVKQIQEILKQYKSAAEDYIQMRRTVDKLDKLVMDDREEFGNFKEVLNNILKALDNRGIPVPVGKHKIDRRLL